MMESYKEEESAVTAVPMLSAEIRVTEFLSVTLHSCSLLEGDGNKVLMHRIMP